jgi:hypothetical protein
MTANVPLLFSNEREYQASLAFPTYSTSEAFSNASVFARTSFFVDDWILSHGSLAKLVCAAAPYVCGVTLPAHEELMGPLPRMRIRTLTLLPRYAPSVSDVVLPDGSRLYTDHDHPELSLAEQNSFLAYVAATEKGREFHAQCAHLATKIWRSYAMRKRNAKFLRAAGIPDSEFENAVIQIHASSTDNKGHSQGNHHNVLLPREDASGRWIGRALIEKLPPYLVVATLFGGAGKLGIEYAAPELLFEKDDKSNYGPQYAKEMVYQHSQRADYVSCVSGGHTTSNRPLVNTRDQSLDPTGRTYRYHDINSGISRSIEQTYMIMYGLTMYARAVADNYPLLPKVVLENPVRAMRDVSRNPHTHVEIELDDGSTMKPLDLLDECIEAIVAYSEEVDIGADPVEIALGNELLRATSRGLHTDWTTNVHLHEVGKWHMMEELSRKYGWGFEFDSDRRLVTAPGNGDKNDWARLVQVDIKMHRTDSVGLWETWEKVRPRISRVQEVPEIKLPGQSETWLVPNTRAAVRAKAVEFQMRPVTDQYQTTALSWIAATLPDYENDDYWHVRIPPNVSPSAAAEVKASSTVGEFVDVAHRHGWETTHMSRNGYWIAEPGDLEEPSEIDLERMFAFLES